MVYFSYFRLSHTSGLPLLARKHYDTKEIEERIFKITEERKKNQKQLLLLKNCRNKYVFQGNTSTFQDKF
jgi:hypothetical protein